MGHVRAGGTASFQFGGLCETARRHFSAPYRFVTAGDEQGKSASSVCARLARHTAAKARYWRTCVCRGRPLHSVRVTHAVSLAAGPLCFPSLLLQAILRANGGTLTDLFGAPILHLPPPHSTKNKLGVLASSGRDTQAPPHSELTEKMRSEPTLLALFEKSGLKGEGAQACDVAR